MELTELIEKSEKILNLMCYEINATDELLIGVLIENTISEVKLKYNLKTLEKSMSMQSIICNMAIGKFLQHKKTFERDSLANLNLDMASIVSSISVGDTSTSYSTSNAKSDEERLDEHIKYLLDSESLLVNYRRIRW